MKVDRPIPFQGSPEEAEANFATHSFFQFMDEEYLDTHCEGCDCKPWHLTAYYPCGTEAPRETIEIDNPFNPQVFANDKWGQ